MDLMSGWTGHTGNAQSLARRPPAASPIGRRTRRTSLPLLNERVEGATVEDVRVRGDRVDRYLPPGRAEGRQERENDWRTTSRARRAPAAPAGVSPRSGGRQSAPPRGGRRGSSEAGPRSDSGRPAGGPTSSTRRCEVAGMDTPRSAQSGDPPPHRITFRSAGRRACAHPETGKRRQNAYRDIHSRATDARWVERGSEVSTDAAGGRSRSVDCIASVVHRCDRYSD